MAFRKAGVDWHALESGPGSGGGNLTAGMGHRNDPDAGGMPDRPTADEAPPGLHEVRVWCARLDWPVVDMARFESWLSVDEKDRAARFRFDRDRHRFVVRRAALRAILGDCLGVSADGIAFAYGVHGKPELSLPDNHLRLTFNASHSQDLGVIAMTVDRAVGIDVESVKPLADYEAIAGTHFTESENQALNRVDPSERVQGFFNCWTSKEAFVKARGEGLTLPLDSFDVSLAPGEPAGLLTCAQAGERERWSIRRFHPASGFVGAVAASGSDWSIQLRQWVPARD